ncbi:hypothetical protein GDO86_017126 [Hymenochirus boettgeri]|uniref:Uncharacterized protein n=1 Tax=Hymenochirus boettgeri TaxID=247094 RepID=A0A8T2ILV4_9PIPI|nr:hypothetical protein GDO86_017126 [Hymenochirus boettgeri]
MGMSASRPHSNKIKRYRDFLLCCRALTVKCKGWFGEKDILSVVLLSSVTVKCKGLVWRERDTFRCAA